MHRSRGSLSRGGGGSLSRGSLFRGGRGSLFLGVVDVSVRETPPGKQNHRQV